jgi:hypothetical protein
MTIEYLCTVSTNDLLPLLSDLSRTCAHPRMVYISSTSIELIIGTGKAATSIYLPVRSAHNFTPFIFRLADFVALMQTMRNRPFARVMKMRKQEHHVVLMEACKDLS